MGSDKIHTWILKEGQLGLCKPLTYSVVQPSLRSTKLPTEWKQALDTSIFKKGSRYDPNNYHQISLTSQVCKVLEYFVSTVITGNTVSQVGALV